jgi:hypothetical protein
MAFGGQPSVPQLSFLPADQMQQTDLDQEIEWKITAQEKFQYENGGRDWIKKIIKFVAAATISKAEAQMGIYGRNYSIEVQLRSSEAYNTCYSG